MKQRTVINAAAAMLGAKSGLTASDVYGTPAKHQNGEDGQAPLFKIDGYPMPIGPVIIFSDENGRQKGVLVDLLAARENRQTSRVWDAIQRHEEPALDGIVVTIGQVTIIKSPQGGVDEYIIVRMD